MKQINSALPIWLFIGALFMSLKHLGHVSGTEVVPRYGINKRFAVGDGRDNRRALRLQGNQGKRKRSRMAQWESCPYLENCQCKSKRTGLDITCNGVTYDQLEKDTNTLKEKERKIGYFKIRDCDIPKLKDFLFMGLQIQYLYITDCKLMALEPESLSSQQHTLVGLVLSSNKISNVPTNAISKLATLQSLDMHANKISTLEENAFATLTNLTKINLYDNIISKLDDKAFDNLAHVEKLSLNLGKNRLTKIPIVALKSLPTLESLDLKENSIQNVETNDFAGLGNLDHLTLQHNEITLLRNQAFKGLPKLNSLYLDHNKISTIEPNAFQGLEKSLQSLQLSHNRISHFPSIALNSFENLKTIYLNKNLINQLKENAFEGYGKSLSYLWLQDNQIAKIPPTTFQDLYRIERLKLSANKLTTIPYELVEPILRSVLHLEIHDNPLVCNCDLNWYPQWINEKEDKMNDDEREDLLDLECRDPKNDRRRYKIRNAPSQVQFKRTY